MTDITPPPPHLLKKFSAQAQDEAKKRNGAGYLKTFATLCIEWAMNSQTTPNDRQIRSSEITPPPELVAQIRRDALHGSDGQLDYELKLIHDAYRAGADQELEACCEWLQAKGWILPIFSPELRAARRPKPPSLAEEALKQLSGIRTAFKAAWGGDLVDEPIRRALERLQDLEEQAND